VRDWGVEPRRERETILGSAARVLWQCGTGEWGWYRTVVVPGTKSGRASAGTWAAT
jgi:hypothetical protein